LSPASPPGFRAALYWVPDLADPLAIAGNHWLGRDPETGTTLPQPAFPDIEARTADARTYGFHATLRPPMRLSTGWPEFLQAAYAMAASLQPFDLPPLQVSDLDGFLALTPAAPCATLQSLADACVAATDRHRLPPSDAELARRRAATLSDEEEALLQRWGYPWVMQRWRFHMTLTDRRGTQLRAAAEAHFADALCLTRRVTDICVFTQPAPGANFLIAKRIELGRGAAKEGPLF
jgi:hypothetical protein